ncbi:MAG: hypothetical protein ACJ735_08955 [Actinomycetes bacterium]
MPGDLQSWIASAVTAAFGQPEEGFGWRPSLSGHLHPHVTLTEASLIVGIVSVLILAGQTWDVARQTRVSAEVAAAAAWSETTDRLHRITEIFLTKPHLRAYFYEGKLPPPDRHEDHAIVLVVAERLADCVEGSLQLGHDIPGADEALQGWFFYTNSLYRDSPALRQWISEHRDWYPRLTELYPD